MNLLIIGAVTLLLSCSIQDKNNDMNDKQIIILPDPDRIGNVSIEETLQKRRSIREYSN